MQLPPIPYKKEIFFIVTVFIIVTVVTIVQNPYLFAVGQVRKGMERDTVMQIMGKPDFTETNEHDIDPLSLKLPDHITTKDRYYTKFLFLWLSYDQYDYYDYKLVSHERVHDSK